MINCILVDDDHSVIIYMKSFIEQTPFLNLIATHFSPKDALITLNSNNIELIFLDIDLPEITGIEFSRALNASNAQKAPRVIFISSHERYALQSYKLDAIDYLLKPISFEDFLRAAYKAKAVIANQTKKTYTENDHIFLKVEYEFIKIYLKDVLYFEAFNNYVKVYTKNHSSFIQSSTTIKNIEEKLPSGSFMRIHRSFIVSMDKIDGLTKNTVRIGKTTIPVSDLFKESFKIFADNWI